ncbi:CorA family divalent cation transporter [Paracidovorax citrulli]|uniref:magnesium transporter CorA family protein n=1 Tax=uncultured Stenotrophomonas sp. TaxID=165438 RepID=UPI0028D48C23|nr:CorA family divalent cation transporter [uncultured Stenotrophomonas sp.]
MNSAPEGPDGICITLYRDTGSTQLALNDLSSLRLADDELLWVDACGGEEESLRSVWDALGLKGNSLVACQGSTNPRLEKFAGCFMAKVVAIIPSEALRFRGAVLTIIAGPNFVVTHHDEEIDFLSDIKDRDPDAACDIGCLGEASFVAAVLDWHLSTYFAACARFEVEIERLESRILSDQPPGRSALPQLCALRGAASRLRRMLAPHRIVFDGLSRADFVPDGNEEVARHLRDLDDRFERAMDVVENARDLVVGSFQLFSTQTELQTNERMKLLTFVTVVTGLLAVIAGALGMNFEANFFGAKTLGFWLAVLLMASLGVAAVVIGKRRGWL